MKGDFFHQGHIPIIATCTVDKLYFIILHSTFVKVVVQGRKSKRWIGHFSSYKGWKIVTMQNNLTTLTLHVNSISINVTLIIGKISWRVVELTFNSGCSCG